MRIANCMVGLAAIALAGNAWPQSAWPGYPNNAAIAVSSSGYVGIGTTTPGVRAEIANNGSAYNLYLSGFAPSLYFGNSQGVFPNGGSGQTASAYLAFATDNGHYGLSKGDVILSTQSFGSGNSSAIRFGVPSNDVGNYTLSMSILRNGNVGIGTLNPLNKLSVNGTIQAKEVLVNTGWSDYVFDPAYRLQPLSEVGEYIQEHRHLPGIPSEAEVKEKGVNVGEMQSKLLADRKSVV